MSVNSTVSSSLRPGKRPPSSSSSRCRHSSPATEVEVVCWRRPCNSWRCCCCSWARRVQAAAARAARAASGEAASNHQPLARLNAVATTMPMATANTVI